MQMLKINLLDWRAELREKSRKQFLASFAVAVVATAAGILLGQFALNNAIDHQHKRNNLLKTEIQAIEKQIKEIQELEKVRDNLIARMQVIEQLQQSRSQIVHYFDEILSTLPDGVFITSLSQSGNKTTINGVAESNGRVSTYMKNLDASPWFHDPRLVIITTKDQGRQRLGNFTLEVTQVVPGAENAAAAGVAQ
jgi:type IV pilus assembly protein PilN